jgi:acetylornithine/N-succinyldiaminopimelate aminotransferase
MSALLPVYQRELVMVSGKGARVTDVDGKEYLDFAAGIGVNGLGHGDPKVVAAIRKQAGRLIHVSNLYHTEVVSRLAERLVSLAFPSRVFFCNSGTEAIEAAIKFSRRIGGPQGRTELVAFEGSFHGRTLGALSLTWKAKYREPFGPLLPGVRFCPWNDLSAARAHIGPRTAGVFVEPVQGEGGIQVAPPDFIEGLRDICRDTGALLVADEVQCGLGRTGKLFAYQHTGVRPDILTLAKPLGGGLPLAAVLLREDLATAIQVGDHGSTFGGNPVAAAAALAVLERLTSKGMVAKVEGKGNFLKRGLGALARKHAGQIRDIRGVGLMIGVELAGPAEGVVQGLRGRGILATKAGDNVLRLLPPLVIKRREIQQLIDAMDEVLATGVARQQIEGGGGAAA